MCGAVNEVLTCNIPAYHSMSRELQKHYNDIIMGAIASQITSLTIVYSTVYSGADQRKHQSSASSAFVRGIHWGPVTSPHKWPVTLTMSPFDNVIMVIVTNDSQYMRLLGRLWIVRLGPNGSTHSRLTHWDRDKINTILQTTFSNAFL